MTTTKKIIAAVVVLAVVVVLLVAVGGLLFWKRPLASLAWMRRAALTRAGLEKTTVDTSVGRQVLWQGGSGPTLVFLHGAGDQAGTWAPVVHAFAGQYRLLILDLPGHGESEPHEGPLSLGTMVEGLSGVLNRKADQPVILVGNSMGGWLALLCARERPEQVARVVIVNGGPLSPDLLVAPRTDLSLMPADREAARRLMNALRDPSSPPVPDFILDDIARRAGTGPISRMPTSPGEYLKYLLMGQLGEIATPVEILWGESDQLLRLDYAQRLDMALAASRLTQIPKCGHIPHLECPEQFTSALKHVMAQDPPTRPEPSAGE